MRANHIDPGFTPEVKERLLKLADIIEKVDPEVFNMGRYLTIMNGVSETVYAVSDLMKADKVTRGEHPCRTVGCIVGHAVLHRKELGIKLRYENSSKFRYDYYKTHRPKSQWVIDWAEIGRAIVGQGPYARDLTRWLFNGSWADYWYDDLCQDGDSPSTAAKRIRYTVENGLPDNWYTQLHGQADPTFLD